MTHFSSFWVILAKSVVTLIRLRVGGDRDYAGTVNTVKMAVSRGTPKGAHLGVTFGTPF